MATNNILKWTPGITVPLESDAEYAADAQRSGGAPYQALFPAALANKLFQQVTVVAAALAQFMAGQGYNAVDNDPNFATNLISALLSITRGINLVAFSATPAFDASKGTGQEITLTGAVTSSTITNLAPGMSITFVIHQDGVGGHPFVWPPQIPGADIDQTPNNTSVQRFYVDATGTVHPLTPLTVS